MKKILIIISSVIVIFISILFLMISKNKDIEIEKNQNLELEVGKTAYISDFIIDDRITIVDNYKIKFNDIGLKTVKYKYKYKNKEKEDSFELNIVDSTAPVIMLNNSYTITKGSDVVLTDSILCADNYDRNITCIIEGVYDKDKVGTYDLTYKATDSSGNETKIPFTLNVKEKSINYNTSYTYFEDILKEYKTDNTSIGIDVSKWQGNIDFKKVKESGAEFVYIRIGVQNGFDGELILDPYFKNNLKNAKENNLKVGVYFFSYAKSKEDIEKQTKWIIEVLNNEKLDLEVVFDWENWSYFNLLDLSFIDLNEMNTLFSEKMNEAGYKTMLYGSKNYLEKVWDTIDKEVWLAHYTSKTNYNGKYKLWQICDNGKINGINGYVDINIMYNN